MSSTHALVAAERADAYSLDTRESSLPTIGRLNNFSLGQNSTACKFKFITTLDISQGLYEKGGNRSYLKHKMLEEERR